MTLHISRDKREGKLFARSRIGNVLIVSKRIERGYDFINIRAFIFDKLFFRA